MSVNGRAANISFASFLKDRMHHPPSNAAAFHPFRTRLGHPLPAQTTATNASKDIVVGCYAHPSFKQTAGRAAPFPRHPYTVLPFSMTAQEQAYFKDYVRDTDELFLPTNLVALPPAFQPNALGGPVWSWDTYHPAFARPPTPAVQKIDNSPNLPTPSVLPCPVDVSKYENVSYEDWYTAPTLYESSSPSTIEYQHSPPATPDDMYSNYSFNMQHHHEVRTHSFSAFSTTSKDLPEMVHHDNFNASSMTNYPVQHISHSLPPTTLLNTTTYPHPLNIHHNPHQISPSPSDLAIASPTPSSSSPSTRSLSPSDVASTTSHKFVLAQDTIATRQQRDDLIVKMRNEGHSYRDIKRFGRFKEAESTLRGRYRALTKDREERVRKPVWLGSDETLLRQAVRYYTQHSNKKPKMRYGRRKLPWKKISQRMVDQGSSYDFAPATCARKWEELGGGR